jgi:hypothetical protein
MRLTGGWGNPSSTIELALGAWRKEGPFACHWFWGFRIVSTSGNGVDGSVPHAVVDWKLQVTQRGIRSGVGRKIVFRFLLTLV